MKPILIAFATREGHTRKIANHIAELLSNRGREVEIREVGAEPINLSGYDAAILAASLHLGRHEREMVKFVSDRRSELGALPTAFLSVSLSEAGAEDATQTAERRAEAASQVAEAMNKFFDATSWHPDRATGVAGALMYSEYNLLIRWVMKRIAASAGAATDTTRDHVYTDWEALDRFVDAFADDLSPAPAG